MSYRNNYYNSLNNPYLPRMSMPNQQMKTPEQYQAELLRQLKPNFDAYNQQYNAYQQQQTIMANSGQYIKVSNYDEVKNVQATSDGKPTIIIDENNLILYSKKFDNGQEYIKSFKLVPNEMKQEASNKNNEENNPNDPMSIILDRLNDIDNRLNKIEGIDNGNSTNVTQ